MLENLITVMWVYTPSLYTNPHSQPTLTSTLHPGEYQPAEASDGDVRINHK